MKRPFLIFSFAAFYLFYYVFPIGSETASIEANDRAGAIESNSTAIGLVIGISNDGRATVIRNGGEKQLNFKDHLFPGDKVTTGPKTRVRLLVGNSPQKLNNVLTLKEHTTVHLQTQAATPSRPKGRFTVKFLSGSGRFVVDKKDIEGTQFDVEGGTAVATIRGSDLALEHTADGRISFTNGPRALASLARIGVVGEPIDLGELQRVVVLPGGVIGETDPVSETSYRAFATSTSPSPGGPQTPSHQPINPPLESAVSLVATEANRVVLTGEIRKEVYASLKALPAAAEILQDSSAAGTNDVQQSSGDTPKTTTSAKASGNSSPAAKSATTQTGTTGNTTTTATKPTVTTSTPVKTSSVTSTAAAPKTTTTTTVTTKPTTPTTVATKK